MRFLNLAFALAGTLAATVSAAPTDNSIVDTGNTAAPAVQCGQFYKIEEEGVMPVYANGHYENLEVATHLIGFENWSCGTCMVFRERDAQGDIIWSGGPGQNGGQSVRGGQSYYCIYGKAPTEAMGTADAVNAVDTRNAVEPVNTAMTCGNYGAVDDTGREDLFTVYANGHYENAERNSVMKWFTNWGCGFCIVFKGHDVQGDVLWSGGPGEYTKAAHGGQSYFCY